MPPGGNKSGDSVGEPAPLLFPQPSLQLLSESPGDGRFRPGQPFGCGRRQWSAGESPQHGPQFGIGMECEAVVDGAQGAVRSPQQVPELAVRVVDEHIEDGNGPEDRVPGLHFTHVIASRHLHELLDGSRAQGPGGGGRPGYHGESHRDREPVGEHLPVGQGGGCEIPEGPLPGRRPVHHQGARGRAWQVGGVAGLGKPARQGLDLDQAWWRRRSPLEAGQMWPSGSTASPQRGQGVRPAATISRLRIAAAASWGNGIR